MCNLLLHMHTIPSSSFDFSLYVGMQLYESTVKIDCITLSKKFTMIASHFYVITVEKLHLNLVGPSLNATFVKAKLEVVTFHASLKLWTRKKPENTPFWYISLKYSQNSITRIFFPHVRTKCQTSGPLLYVHTLLDKTRQATTDKDTETI